MFVLQGLAGTGKSTIAHTMCKITMERGWLGASFFFSRNEASCSNPFLVFTTIAYQLATRYPQFRQSLTNILKADPDVVGLTLEMQLEKLVVEPMRAAADEIGSTPVIVVIDALDECSNYRAQIMSLLCNVRRKLPIRFKLFASLRPEHDLKTALSSQGTHWGAESFILHDVDTSVVRGDIQRFLRHRLSQIAAKYPNVINPHLWPSTEDISTLAEKSDKLFIFAATVVKFVDDKAHDPISQLDVVLKTPDGSKPSPFQHLDQLYWQVLEKAFPDTSSEMVLESFCTVMGAVTLLYDTVSILGLSRLLRMGVGEIHMALLHLHSVVIVPDNVGEIRLIHPSFRDFMTQRCPKGSIYFINPPDRHRQLALICLKTMHDNLRKDICGIRDMWKLNEEVEDLNGRITAFIPAHVQYACRYWATHLSESSPVDDVVDALMMFSSQHLLHWLEVLSLIGCLAEALPALRHVQNWTSVSHIY
jgi:hypothetical protein